MAAATAGWCAGRSARTSAVVLRQATELAIWQTAMVAKAVPEARASRAARASRPRPSRLQEDGGEGGQRHHRLGRPEDPEGPAEDGAVDRPCGRAGRCMMPSRGGSVPSASAGSMSVPMSSARTCSTPIASGKLPAGQRPHPERRQLGDVVGQVEGEEPADVLERRAAELDRGHDRGEVVVEQHQVGGLAGHVAAVRAHRHPDVGLAQRRGVVDAVAGHGDDVPRALEHAGDPQLVGRGGPRDDHATGRCPGSAASSASSAGRVEPVEHHTARPEEPDLRGRSRRRWRGWSPVIIATRMPAVAAGGQRRGDLGVRWVLEREQPQQVEAVLHLRRRVAGPVAAATASTRRPWPASRWTSPGASARPPVHRARTCSGRPEHGRPAAAQAGAEHPVRGVGQPDPAISRSWMRLTPARSARQWIAASIGSPSAHPVVAAPPTRPVTHAARPRPPRPGAGSPRPVGEGGDRRVADAR